MNYHFDIKHRLVVKGKSAVYENWKTFVPSLTKAEFLEGLRWLCEDPGIEVNGKERMSRELGLTTDGVVQLRRVYHDDGSFAGFYANDSLWTGDSFEVACDNPNFTAVGKIQSRCKISISPMDKV